MTTCRNKVLELKNIYKIYQNTPILEDVSLELNKNEMVCLLGRSGSGKTTLFNIAAGLLEPESGKVFINGLDVTGEVGHVGYMLQKDLLLNHMTIEENLALPKIIAETKNKKLFSDKGKKAEAIKEAVSYFKLFGIENTEKLYPYQLSGGMRQRASLLRTYMSKKDIVLLDEPFSALDEINKNILYNWYLNISKELNLSTLFITHSIDEAIYLADRIYILGENHKIQNEIKIETKKRDTEFKLSEEFLEYKRKLVDILGE